MHYIHPNNENFNDKMIHMISDSLRHKNFQSSILPKLHTSLIKFYLMKYNFEEENIPLSFSE